MAPCTGHACSCSAAARFWEARAAPPPAALLRRGTDRFAEDDASVPATDAEVGDALWLPDTPPIVYDSVYAHGPLDLYKIDPDTLEITLVGKFNFPSGESMTDIALDQYGNMVGISYGKVYAVNRETAGCTYLAALDRSFNGLSFVPGDEIRDRGGRSWSAPPSMARSTSSTRPPAPRRRSATTAAA